MAKVVFTTFLYVSPCRSARCAPDGVPLHFHSSVTSGSCLLDQARGPGSISPPPIAQILDSRVYQRSDGDSAPLRPGSSSCYPPSLRHFSPLPCDAPEPRESLAQSGSARGGPELVLGFRSVCASPAAPLGGVRQHEQVQTGQQQQGEREQAQDAHPDGGLLLSKARC